MRKQTSRVSAYFSHPFSDLLICLVSDSRMSICLRALTRRQRETIENSIWEFRSERVGSSCHLKSFESYPLFLSISILIVDIIRVDFQSRMKQDPNDQRFWKIPRATKSIEQEWELDGVSHGMLRKRRADVRGSWHLCDVRDPKRQTGRTNFCASSPFGAGKARIFRIFSAQKVMAGAGFFLWMASHALGFWWFREDCAL